MSFNLIKMLEHLVFSSLNTHKNHSMANSRETACTGMLSEDRTMIMATILALGTAGRARLDIEVSKL